jgi:hypothetical protein
MAGAVITTFETVTLTETSGLDMVVVDVLVDIVDGVDVREVGEREVVLVEERNAAMEGNGVPLGNSVSCHNLEPQVVFQMVLCFRIKFFQ